MGENINQINISPIDNTYERTLLYFLSNIYKCEIQVSEDLVKQFIDVYLANAKMEIEMPSTRTLKFDKEFKFVDEAINEYSECIKQKKNEVIIREFLKMCDLEYKNVTEEISEQELYFIEKGTNSGIYNICTVIIMCDKLLEDMDEYIDAVECKCYYEARLIAVRIEEALVMIEGAVTSFILDMHGDNIGDISQNYRIMPDIPFYMKPQKQLLSVLENFPEEQLLSEKGSNCYPLITFMLAYDIVILRRKVDILKFLLAFICIVRSPEYTCRWKKYAYTFSSIFRDVLMCGTLHKVLLQKANLTGNAEERGNADATTRIEIVFSLENEDIYILRIDMPHKGEKKPHVNLEECTSVGISATGFPIRYEQKEYDYIKKLPKVIFEKLFWHFNNRVWFKHNYVGILEKLNVSEDVRIELNSIFEGQKHKTLDIEYEEEDLIAFLSEINVYVERFNLMNIVSGHLGKMDDELYKHITKIRKNQRIYRTFAETIIKKDISYFDLYDDIWNIYSPIGLKEVGREILNEMDLKTVWKTIERYCM